VTMSSSPRSSRNINGLNLSELGPKALFLLITYGMVWGKENEHTRHLPTYLNIIRLAAVEDNNNFKFVSV